MDELEQTEERFGSVSIDLIDGLVDLDARAFKFDLHEREPIDEHCYVVTVCLTDILDMILIHRHLMSDLIGVPLIVFSKEFKIDGFAVVQIEDPFLTQNFRRLVDRVVEKTNLHAFELGIRQRRLALCFDELVPVDLADLLSEICEQVVMTAHLDELVSYAGELFNEAFFNGVFRFGLRHSVPSLPPITLWCG